MISFCSALFLSEFLIVNSFYSIYPLDQNGGQKNFESRKEWFFFKKDVFWQKEVFISTPSVLYDPKTFFSDMTSAIFMEYRA